MGLSWEVSLGRWDPLGRVLDLGHSQAGFCLPCAQLLQSCPTLCDHRTFSPPDSSVHGISQARLLEWVAISFSRGLSDPGIESISPAWQAYSLPLSLLRSPILVQMIVLYRAFPSLRVAWWTWMTRTLGEEPEHLWSSSDMLFQL